MEQNKVNRLIYELGAEKHGADYMYRQLAEECCELAQAALKVIRAHKGETPKRVDDADTDYIEELADVALMINIMLSALTESGQQQFDEDYNFKHDRFINRILKVNDA